METIEKILSDLKAKKWSPIYFLMGEEAYHIDIISRHIENTLLSESEKLFDQTVIYGRDTNIQTIISYSKQYPMVGSHTVVIVKEAQQLSKNIEELVTYTENPASRTILVICYKYKTLEKRKKLYKSIQQHGMLFESKKLYEYQIPGWIDTQVKKMGYTITKKAKFLLAEYIGNDLSRLAGELNKLTIILPKNSEITADSVEAGTGISKTYKHFELQKALVKKDIFAAYKIAHHFGKNPKDYPLAIILTMLYNFFTNLIKYHAFPSAKGPDLAKFLNISPCFLKDYTEAAQQYSLKKILEIISHLRKTDTQSKGIESPHTSEQELLKELLFKILH